MIPMNAFQREPESLRAEEMRAVHAVLESGWFILGERVRTFESEWASRIGAKHAITNLGSRLLGSKMVNRSAKQCAVVWMDSGQ